MDEDAELVAVQELIEKKETRISFMIVPILWWSMILGTLYSPPVQHHRRRGNFRILVDSFQ